MTIGTEGFTLPANTLLKEALQIINGVEPGVTGIDYGIVTPVQTDSVTVSHNLGVVPSYAVILKKTPWNQRYYDHVIMAGSSGYLADHSTSNPNVSGPKDKLFYSATAESIKFKRSTTTEYYQKGITYIWFAVV